jgi:hypothetical protein
MIIAEINSDGVVQSLFNSRKGYTDSNGIRHSPQIFSVWSDSELNAVGAAIFNEVAIAQGKQSTGFADVFNGKVTRTHNVEDIPDAQGTDADAPGYDDDYANTYKQHRSNAYNMAGATIDALTVAIFEADGQGTPDNTERDRLRIIRQAVKARFPKPS